MGRYVFQDVTEIVNGAIQVKLDGLWGLAAVKGSIVIPFTYQSVSGYSSGEIIVKSDGEISAVNTDNNRLVLCHEEASEFGPFNQNRTSIKLDDGWAICDGEFNHGASRFDAVGMFTDDYAPVMRDGKWGLVDWNVSSWKLELQYDDIIRDDVGRAFARNRLFVSKDGQIQMIDGDGALIAGPFEDARPFVDGCAAVKQGGKWGFVDTAGEMVIDYQ